MKRIYLINIILETMLGETILFLSSIFFSIPLLTYIVIIAANIILLIVDRRPPILFLSVLFSDTSFRIKRYENDDEKKENVESQIDTDYLVEEYWKPLKSKMYFSPISNEEFLKNFRWMIKHYDRKGYANQKDVELIIKNILEYIKLDTNVVRIEVEKDALGHTAGYFETRAEIGGNININVYNGMTFYQLFSVCFHECIHYWFFRNEIEFGEDEEYIVDVAMIYFGLDEIALKGYEESTQLSKKLIHSKKDYVLGYLDTEELREIMLWKRRELE